MDLNLSFMNLSLTPKELTGLLSKQLEYHFPVPNRVQLLSLSKIVNQGIERLEYCFSRIKLKYYHDENGCSFNHLHSDQYSKFLYFVSREAYLIGEKEIYEKCSYLNKIMNGVDLYGHIEMPDIFLLVHPLGSIFGRAEYGNFMIFYQGVTIGGKHETDGIKYPKFSERTACFSNSSIIGKVASGKNVIFGANSSIIGGTYIDNSLVLGSYPNNMIKSHNNSIFEDVFKF